ncbi:MAG: NAD-dependent epimerase/dehydratase family protein [Myxococcales bacterium]|nr:NAD-dependent epimerase/dehydratase family protein [Myxococcales bacterium]
MRIPLTDEPAPAAGNGAVEAAAVEPGAADLRGARVVVTGGRGFLGRQVVELLCGRGAHVVAPARDEVDLADVRRASHALADLRPDYLVHCAATGGGIGFMRAHPGTSCTDNVLVNTSAIEAARLARVRRYVGVSSACAYPGRVNQPMREPDIGDGEPEPTNAAYGHAKRLMLVQGEGYAHEYGLDCAFAVPTNLYGPGDDYEEHSSHVVAALIRRFEAARIANAGQVIVWGTGRATRDLLYVRDCAEGVVRLLETGAGPGMGPWPRAFNLGSGRETPVLEIAESVAGAVGFMGELGWDGDKPDGMPRKVLDSGRMRTQTGWFAATSLIDGLARAVTDFRARRG